ncbi:glycosyltransferase [Flavobacterium sp. 7A]|uniref:glycosyltransferase n=1 Tax=Flavobacterium sp. 7A TaxID=2940571 RepID=UPI00222727AD|nr:glycosyltransferase [Flavobacterium sp. 7A]MCW2119201.1 uncharacterized protein (TIGR00661 family) [Flavobacterium sp. 7A]
METEYENKTILITVLNWGLGHATRCIPIIKKLHNHNFTTIIASDGQALLLLKKEFPYILCLQLPTTAVEYPKKGKYFKLKLVQNLPKIAFSIYEENKIISKWVKKYELAGILSDNRMGCYSTKIPSVYLTHQVSVLTGNTTWISTRLHQYFIKKFSACWVPDVAIEPNLSGILSHSAPTDDLKLVYIGPVSRLHPIKTEKKYDLMILLSGPEPQRGLLEQHLIKELNTYIGKVVFVKGTIEKTQTEEHLGNITYYNFMKTRQLEQFMQESEIVLCRSGYTTIMDLVKLNKKAFFIPTPGQYEQIYLAEKFEKEGLVPYSNQENFKIDDLKRVKDYSGLSNRNDETNWTDILKIFDKKQ